MAGYVTLQDNIVPFQEFFQLYVHVGFVNWFILILIKEDDKAKYKNIVDVIDEMAICNIASYAVISISPIELDMLKTAPK